MPSTVNGIGTHYYGKSNASRRTAHCGSCGAYGNLESYDTRLWFVVIFIPLIPLGRKRIIDYCGRCTRHMAANADEYAQAVQNNVSDALAKHRAEPTPASALTAHATLLSLHQHEGAAGFREEALAEFPDSAELVGGLAEHLDHFGVPGAGELHERALQLQPDLPSARVGAAFLRMNQGKLDEARGLLDFLEQPGAGAEHNVLPLDHLSSLYQNAGRHQEALDLSKVLLRELPEAGQQAKFRAFVKKSERALNVMESALPESRRGLRALFFGGPEYTSGQRWAAWSALIAVLVTAGLAFMNERIRTNRTLHFVSGFPEPVEVRIDGGPPLRVSQRGQATVSEGKHAVQVSGPLAATYDIDLQCGYFERFFKSPVWAVNVGGAALLYEQTAIYRSQRFGGPVGGQDPPPRVHLGETFLHAPDVDYAFVEPPRSLSVKGSGSLHKECVGVHQAPPEGVAMMLRDRQPEAATALLESVLRTGKENDDALQMYLLATARDRARADRLFSTRLAERPVSMLWHRHHQRLAEGLRGTAAVAKEYDGYLAKEPANAALQYLRARVESDPAKRLAGYEAAAAADPKSYWPRHGAGMLHAGNAAWGKAIVELRAAGALGMDERHYNDELHAALLGSGDAAGALKAAEATLKKSPSNARAGGQLADALVALGQRAKAVAKAEEWRRQAGGNGEKGNLGGAALAFYVLGDWPNARATAATVAGMAPKEIGDFYTLEPALASGEGLDEVQRAFAARPPVGRLAWAAVGLHAALAAKRDPAAAEWRGKAAAALKAETADYAKAGDLLLAAATPAVKDVEALNLDADEKSLLLATLAQLHPPQRDAFAAAAKKYLQGFLPPNQLTRRLLEQKP